MSKRKYTNLKVLLPQIQAMLSEGKSHREIEEYFGLTGERPVHHLLKPEHNAQLAKEIQECQEKTDKTYGYRRVWRWLKDRNIVRNPKTVLRVMKKYGLLSEIRRRRKWVNLGQQVHKYKNLYSKQ